MVTFRHAGELEPLVAGEIRFHVVRWEEFETEIVSPSTGKVLRVPALRIFVREGEKPFGPPYWDLARPQLVTALQPLLPRLAGQDLTVHVSDPFGRGGQLRTITVDQGAG